MRILVLLFSILLFTSAFAENKYKTNPSFEYQHFLNHRAFFTAGAFRNSKSDAVSNAAVGWESFKKKRLLGVPYRYGVIGGLSTGYRSTAIAAPYIRFENRAKRVRLKVMALPHPKRSVFGFGISIKLGK